MSKARKMTILTITNTMFNENVHTGCLFFNWDPLKVQSVRLYLPADTDIIRFLSKRRSDLASSNKGYTGYREVLSGIGGPNQANLEA